MTLKTSNISQRRQWFPERWKTNEASPQNAPVYYCFQFVSRVQCGAGETRQSLAISLSWVDGAGFPGKPRCLEFAGEQRSELCKENSGDLKGMSLWHSIECRSAHACEETTGDQGKNHLKRSEGTAPAGHRRPEIEPVPTTQREKPCNSQSSSYST